MPVSLKLIAASLAASVFGMTLAAAPVFADSASSTPTTAPVTVAPPTDRQLNVAIDALHDVLNVMVDRGAMRPEQRADVLATARAADWDGYSIERLGDILQPLVARDVITAAQRDAILDGVRHSRANIFRLAVVLDRMSDQGQLTAAQHDAIVDALHHADWDGFSVERLGDILQRLVNAKVITPAQRAAILDGMRR